MLHTVPQRSPPAASMPSQPRLVHGFPQTPAGHRQDRVQLRVPHMDSGAPHLREKCCPVTGFLRSAPRENRP